MAIAAVLALHGVFALWLIRTLPIVATDRERANTPRMRLIFVPRPLQTTSPQTPPSSMLTRSTSPRRAASAGIHAATTRSTQAMPEADMQQPSARPSDSTAATSGTPSQSLNLSLPATVVGTPASVRNPMQHTAPVVYQTTRFANDWTPDGGEIQQTWAFRSKLAGAALSMTGALRQPCMQRERDQRLQKCFGKQYQGDVDPPAGPTD
ncbi:hypothetical protein XaplCFBP3122_12380 [Xanthomonas arboricola pv. populi]|uniref:Uncharacterized protein n=1 Tax=Xanthomonas arboricola pv. populi TaxID=487823 RepID=A0A2S6Z412_9XANT|nr:hypothetical protein [Xanthomonas arboricola]PPT75636.1 hypothetical protein XaplCFBP3122_12380 [Xanthomonas arboricola pv. populi]